MRTLVLIAAAVVAAPSFAQTPAPATPAAAPSPDSGDKMVCRSEETIGSRLKTQKVCLTQREWQERERENREAVELYQQRNQSTVPSADPPDTPTPL